MVFKSNGHEVKCPRCGQRMDPKLVKTTVWNKDSLYVIEDIPAQVCSSCSQQIYDEDTANVIQRVTEEGFSHTTAIREILVPVFSLADKKLPSK